MISFKEDNKPCLAMILVQTIYSAMALSAKAAFAEGMDPMVFVVYRQAIATMALAPASIIIKGGDTRQMSLCMRAFCLVFIASLVGAILNQYLYYQGLAMASSSMATAMTNLIPAFTFVMAALFGLEKVNVKSLRSMAKVIGTVICVGGALSMGFLKGPKLLNMDFHRLMILLKSTSDTWVVGCLALMGSTCCWSFWLILQVPICKNYLDPLSLSTWMCLISTLQSAILTLILKPDWNVWRITSALEFFCCLFAGVFGSGVTFYLQSWSIAVRGPLYSAMFNPLNTVITTIFAVIFLHEQLYIGSFLGAIVVVAGLYIVLWGKAKDLDSKNRLHQQVNESAKITISVDEKLNDRDDPGLRKPLIYDQTENIENQCQE